MSVGGKGQLTMEQCTVQYNKAKNKVSYDEVVCLPLLLLLLHELCCNSSLSI
jgi:hypothetical protein